MSSSTHFVVVLLLSLQHINFIYFEREEEREREGDTNLAHPFYFHSITWLAPTSLHWKKKRWQRRHYNDWMNERASKQIERPNELVIVMMKLVSRLELVPVQKKECSCKSEKQKKRSDIYGRNKSLGIERKHWERMNTTNLWFMHVHLFGMQYRPERSDSIWTISVFQRKKCLLAGAGMHFVCDIAEQSQLF